MTTGDALFENGVFPVLKTDCEISRLLKVNSVFRQWFLLDNPDISLLSFSQPIVDICSSLNKKSPYYDLSLSVRHKNGKEIHCLATVHSITENDETSLLFIINDSLTKNEESVMHKSRSANLYALSENIEDAFWSIDCDNNLIEFNRKFSEMMETSYSCTIRKGEKFPDIFDESTTKLWRERLTHTKKGERREYTDTMLGSTLISTLMPIYSEYGEVIGVCCTTRDITEDINRRKNLEVLHNRFNSILNSSADAAIIATDPQGIVRQFNSGASQMLGYGKEEAIGKTDLLRFYAPSFMRKVRNYIRTETGKNLKMNGIFPYLSENPDMVKNMEWKLMNKQGRLLDVKISISPVLMDDQSYAGVLIIAQDITELNRVKEELEKAKLIAEETSRTKTSFLANMSHEIRTPLNGIIGMADLLMRSELDDHQKTQLSIVQKSANTLLLLINDILDYTRIEAGKFKLGLSSFSIRDLLNEIRDILLVNIREKKIDFDILIDKSVTDQVIGDPRRIKQILMNLVGNAMKFTIEGSINVEVYQISQAKESISLFFKVIDTGIGISKEEKDKLFQTFSQVDSSATRKYGGSGLGLAISKELVMMMDGEIGMESTPEQGSTFWFTVKLEKDRTEMEDRKALVINNNMVSRRVLAKSLRNLHLKVDEIPHPDEMEKSKQYNLIFLDEQWVNPLPDNFKKQKNSQFVLTSFDREEIPEGMDYVLKLPASQKSLEDCLHKMMQKSLSNLVMAHNGEDSDEEKQQKLQTIKVLVAEDNKINQLVAMNFLKKLGYAATLVENGQEAVEACRKEEFQVILMDQMMPVMDGIEATEKIRSLGPDSPNSDIIIIALTANAMKGDRELLLNAGMNDYISKPVLLNEIKKVLEKNLRKKGII